MSRPWLSAKLWIDSQVDAIFKICYSNDIPDIPDHLSSEAKSFLKLCLQRDPAARPTAAQLMDHLFAKENATFFSSGYGITNVMFPTSTDGNNSWCIIFALAFSTSKSNHALQFPKYLHHCPPTLITNKGNDANIWKTKHRQWNMIEKMTIQLFQIVGTSIILAL